MAENSKIEWTDHTFNPSGCWLRVAPQFDLMGESVTALAQGYAISSVEPQFWEVGKRPDVMRVEIAARVIPAMGARKIVPAVHVIAPSFQFSRSAKPAPLNSLAIYVSGGVGATHGTLANRRTDLRSCLKRVRLAKPVARASLSCRTHLRPAFVRHFGATCDHG